MKKLLVLLLCGMLSISSVGVNVSAAETTETAKTEETKAERLFIESYVRMKLEQEPDLHHIQNDHFTYKIIGKDEKYY